MKTRILSFKQFLLQEGARVARPALKFTTDLFQRTQTHHQSAFAAQIAFFFFLSLFPFITVFVTIAGGFISIDALVATTLEWRTIPAVVQDLILSFLHTAKSQHIPILSISFATIFWSTSRAYYALAPALSAAQGIEKAPNYWLSRAKGLIFTLLLSLILLIAVLLPIFSGPVVSTLVKWVALPAIFTPIILALKWTFYALILGLLLLISYALVPPIHMPLKQLVPGVCFTLVGWWLEAIIFNTFVLKFTRFSLIYGTLATVVVLLLWLYTLAGTLIMGAHVNALIGSKS